MYRPVTSGRFNCTFYIEVILSTSVTETGGSDLVPSKLVDSFQVLTRVRGVLIVTTVERDSRPVRGSPKYLEMPDRLFK